MKATAQQQAKQGQQTNTQAELIALSDADTLVGRAHDALTEQTALLEATPLESQFSAVFAALVEAKHDQAERLEERLEALIERQASRLLQTQSDVPGLLVRPAKRTQWQQQIQQQQGLMQRLQGRLETLREIKDGMGIHAPRIEELAARKLRVHEPQLALDWDDMLEAQRLRQALLRKQERESQRLERTARGQGLCLGLSQTR